MYGKWMWPPLKGMCHKSSPEFRRETPWSRMDRTNFRPAAALSPIRPQKPRPERMAIAPSLQFPLLDTRALEIRMLDTDRIAGEVSRPREIKILELRRNESVPPIYPSAGRYFPSHVRHPAGGDRRIPATAGFGAARGGLPHNPGQHVLSGR